MIKVCRLFCCRVKKAWIAASEMAATNVGIKTCTAGALCTVALLAAGNAHALPTGGQVAAGQAAISQTANQMQINQSSNHAIINWNSFGIAANEAVNISQPSSQAALLNRVIGGAPSEIFGRLTANGQVFLINPSGILFAPGASVSVGGLVASSLNIKDDDFMAGSYRFFNDGKAGSVINRGDIQAGFAALLGPTAENSGSIITTKGSTALGGADSITLDFDANGLIALKLDKGAYGAQVTNSGVIEADGGRVILTAKSADDIMKSMVNTSGAIRARTVESRNGEILLLGDMENGTLKVAGTLDASAPNGGNGGFVETSAAKVRIADSARVTTLAPRGKNGTWLIDPDGFTIAASDGDISGATLSANLSGGDINLASTSGSGADGNINVNDIVSWNANMLTLTATNDINVNAVMTASGTASLDLEPGSGKVNMGLDGSGFTGRVDFPFRSGSGFLTINGIGYTVLDSLGAAGSTTGTDLQGMGGDLTGNFALGSSIDATGTNAWNAGNGFVPVGNNATNFTGRFDGLGHTISNLTINVAGTDYVGLFGYASGATIRNVGLEGGSVTATKGAFVGALVGMNDSISAISNAYATTSVTGGVYVGGLVGGNDHGSIINNGYAIGAVTGLDGGGPFFAGATEGIGGLVGINDNDSSISNSQASGVVLGKKTSGGSFLTDGKSIGGLVGINDHGSTISDSSAFGSVTGWNKVGGLVGLNDNNSSINNAYASTSVTGGVHAGGLVGGNDHGGAISNARATGSVTGVDGVGSFLGVITEGIGGLVGINDNGSSISNADASGVVMGENTSGGLPSTDGNSIGGLVGINGHNSTIIDAFATGSVTGRDNVGGLVGFNNNASAIISSYATGAVTGTGDHVGGLAGQNEFSTISDAYATGAVSGNDYVGGLVGWINGGTVSNTYSTGKVTGAGVHVGGLAGENDGNIENSFWNIDTSNQNITPGAAGAVGLTTAELKSLFTFSTWDIDDAGGSGKIWRIYDGNTYPLLRSFLTPLTVTAIDTSKTYDGTFNFSGNGVTWSVAGADTSPNLLGTLSYSSNSKNAGLNAITPSGYYSNQQGYDIAFASGVLTIYPAMLTLNAVTDSKVYDGTTESAGTATYAGLKGGDNLIGLTQSFDSKNVLGANNSTLKVNMFFFLDDGNFGNNYIVISRTASGTITPAALTLNAVTDSKVYDGTTGSAGVVTSAGLMGGDSLSGLTQAFGSNNVLGANNSTLSINGGYTLDDGNSGSNYTVTTNTAGGTITKAPLTITAGDATKIENGQAFSGGNGVNYSGLVNGESPSVLGGTLAYGGTSQGSLTTGTYTITPYGQTSDNYAIRYIDGVLNIFQILDQLAPLQIRHQPAPLQITDQLAPLQMRSKDLVVHAGDDKLLVVQNGGVHAPAPSGADKAVTFFEYQKLAAVKPVKQTKQEIPVAVKPVEQVKQVIPVAVKPVEQVKQETGQSSKESPQSSGFESVYFKNKKTDLTPSAREVLAKSAAAMKEALPGLKIRIEGNCDEVGSAKINKAMGELRARSVLKYLVTLGVPENIFTVVSYGKERPVALEHNEAARAKNRRVDLVVVSP